MLAFAPWCGGAVYYVDANFQGESPTGDSWLSAFPDIQAAIDAADETGGGEVWVKAGIHMPSAADRSATFLLKPGVALYGGFRGTETERSERNAKVNRTILRGDIGRMSFPDDNSWHVVTAASNARLDGCIVSLGNADGETGNGLGGGLLVPKATKAFAVVNCTFEKNGARQGGAIFADTADMTISNCTFYSNSANSGGAVATSGNTVLRIMDSTFSSNFAKDSGGALFFANSTAAIIKSSFFLYNNTPGRGGAIAALADQDAGIRLGFAACTFSDNSATQTGGAVFHQGRFSPFYLKCDFRRNFSAGGAGAMANQAGTTAKLAECSFTQNNGTKAMENIGSDDQSNALEEPLDPDRLARILEKGPPATVNPKPVTPVAPKPTPVVQPKRQLADVFVHNTQDTKVKLRSIVAASPHTVLVLGDLTDPDFIRHYRTVEAMARDYLPKGVNFFHLYRFLAHPENHGFLQPFTQAERARQVQLAVSLLHTAVPWLYDTMDNQAVRDIAPGQINNVFIFNGSGLEEYAGTIADQEGIRKALAELAGTIENPTPADSRPAPEITAIELPEPKLVERIEIDPGDGFQPLQVTPLVSRFPHYVKLRAEGNENLIKTGSGFIYLGFHIDPLYTAEWNNLGEPLHYAMKVPPGSAVAPSIGSAPRIANKATDSEPREFLLEARKLDTSQPIPLQVQYSVHNPETKRNIEVSQQYMIYLERDPFGGQVFNRQIAPGSTNAKTTRNNERSFADWCSKLDLDRDGFISHAEAAGILRKLFPQIDANQDGKIDEREYLAYRSKH